MHGNGGDGYRLIVHTEGNVGAAADGGQSSGKAVKVSKRRWVASKLDLLTQCAVGNA